LNDAHRGMGHGCRPTPASLSPGRLRQRNSAGRSITEKTCYTNLVSVGGSPDRHHAGFLRSSLLKTFRRAERAPGGGLSSSRNRSGSSLEINAAVQTGGMRVRCNCCLIRPARSCMVRPPDGNRCVSVLFMPLRPWAAHVVHFRTIGAEQISGQVAPEFPNWAEHPRTMLDPAFVFRDLGVMRYVLQNARQ